MRTLTIIKPDGVKQHVIGEIIRAFEEYKFEIVAMRMLQMTKKDAEGFYAVHRNKPFYNSLTTFMSSGPAVVMVLEAEEVIDRLRDLMGATNPAEAAPDTLRKRFATSTERNIIHGSDAPQTAAIEIRYFFSELEIVT